MSRVNRFVSIISHYSHICTSEDALAKLSVRTHANGHISRNSFRREMAFALLQCAGCFGNNIRHVE